MLDVNCFSPLSSYNWLCLCVLRTPRDKTLSLGIRGVGGKPWREIATLGGGWDSPGLPKIKHISSPPGLISFRNLLSWPQKQIPFSSTHLDACPCRINTIDLMWQKSTHTCPAPEVIYQIPYSHWIIKNILSKSHFPKPWRQQEFLVHPVTLILF